MVNWCTILQISIVHRKLRPKLSKKKCLQTNNNATCFKKISKQNALSLVDYLRTLNMSIIIIKRKFTKLKINKLIKDFQLNIFLYTPSGLVDEPSFFLAGEDGRLLGRSGWGFPSEDDDTSFFLVTCGDDDSLGFSTTSHSWS